MKKFYVLHIHSTFSSFSSGDVMLYKEFNSPDHFLRIKESIGDENIRINYLYSNTIFYKKALASKKPFSQRYEKTEEFNSLVESFVSQGWQKERPKEIDDFFDREELKNKQNRIKKGFVVIDQEKMKPEDYKGGLSLQLFNNHYVKKYVSSQKYLFGYIGHSVRTNEIDIFLENQIMKSPWTAEVAKEDAFGIWLTSSAARHFCDSLEGVSLNQAKNKIKKNITNILLTGSKYLLENK